MTNVSLSIGHTPNYATVTVGPVTLHFSYQTVIAFRAPGTGGTIIRKNDWGPTTGKHLNSIDGGSPTAKAQRLDGDKFETYLAQTIERIEVAS